MLTRILSDLDRERAIKVLAFANTPNYVFKNLKTIRSIQDIAHKYKTIDLIQTHRELLKIATPSADDYLLLYVLLIVFMMKGDSQSINYLEELRKVNIRWFPEIINIFKSEFIPTTKKKFQIDETLIFI